MSNNRKIISFAYSLFGVGGSRSNKQRAVTIAIHVLAWMAFFSLPLLFFNIQFNNNKIFLKETINKVFLVAFFYFNYYYLIPVYFSRQKRRLYVTILLSSFLLLFTQQVLTERYFVKDSLRFFIRGMPGRQQSGAPREPVFTRENGSVSAEIQPPSPGQGMMPGNEKTVFGIPFMFFVRVITNLLSTFFIMVLLGGFIRLAYSFFKTEGEKKLLENANLTAENNLLKSQINPHFLFNSLNSIYSQAMKKSENTEASILKLSEILRYMIYETGSEKILVEKDIYYISSYIDLQRLRLPSKVSINYNITGNTNTAYISPLILITYIENAFKHGISYSQPSDINIFIVVKDKELTLLVNNPVVREQSSELSGIGQKNTKRRLEMLYPEKHQLNIAEDNDSYTVHLKINLN